VQDITERKQVEEALRESVEHFRSMVEQAPLGVAIVDSLTAQFYLVNPTLARITGRTVEELQLIDWVAITHPDDIQRDLDQMAAMNAGEIPGFQMEKRYRRSDGTYFWVNITVAPMYVTDETRPRHLLMVEDIDVRKQAEEERERIREQQRMLVHMVSHDLRAPLTIVGGHADLLAEYLGEQQGDHMTITCLQAIIRGVKRMNVMVDDLTDAARLEGGQLHLECEAIDLGSYLPGFFERSTAALNTERIALDLGDDLCPVWAEAARLDRILMNLCTNALKYSTPETTVMLAARRQDREIVISVTDHGRGIAPDELPHLFERFYRAAGARKAEGIGLGLYITRLMVEAHGGRIWAESDVGQGSTFAFTLPIVQ
jgi:PAS domain S-box-containing protein